MFLDKEQIGAKRRKKIPHFSDYFQGEGGGPPGMGGAGGGGFGFTGFGLFPTFNLMGLQPSSQGEFNRNTWLLHVAFFKAHQRFFEK